MLTERFDTAFRAAYEAAKSVTHGHVSTDLPTLEHANPDTLGISAFRPDTATQTWRLYQAGAVDVATSAQSVSKVVNEAVARTVYGAKYSSLIGSGRSGQGYNDVAIDAQNRPVNGMMNFGAIGNGILLHDAYEKLGVNTAEHLEGYWQKITGKSAQIDEKIYQEDKACQARGEYDAHIHAFLGEYPQGANNMHASWRNQGITLDKKTVEGGMDIFLRYCSLQVTATDLAKLAAVLQNHGTNPFTGETIFSHEVSHAVSESMHNGGLYAETADIAAKTGDAPSKSGISGTLISHNAINQDTFAFGAYSPRLTQHGNSVSGVAALETLVHELAASSLPAKKLEMVG